MNVMTETQGKYASPFKARYDNFIGGEFVAPVNGRYFDNITPITGAKVCEVARSDAADVEKALADGRAMDAWRDMICAQDGDPDAALPAPKETHVVTAPEDGYVARLDALSFGVAAWRLGAGRARAEDPVVHAAGIDLHAKPGDRVRRGQPLFTLLADDAARFDRALAALDGAWDIAAEATVASPIVRERITA